MLPSLIRLEKVMFIDDCAMFKIPFGQVEEFPAINILGIINGHKPWPGQPHKYCAYKSRTEAGYSVTVQCLSIIYKAQVEWDGILSIRLDECSSDNSQRTQHHPDQTRKLSWHPNTTSREDQLQAPNSKDNTFLIWKDIPIIHCEHCRGAQ